MRLSVNTEKADEFSSCLGVERGSRVCVLFLLLGRAEEGIRGRGGGGGGRGGGGGGGGGGGKATTGSGKTEHIWPTRRNAAQSGKKGSRDPHHSDSILLSVFEKALRAETHVPQNREVNKSCWCHIQRISRTVAIFPPLERA